MGNLGNKLKTSPISKKTIPKKAKSLPTSTIIIFYHFTVTLFARFRGLSGSSIPLSKAR